MMITWVVLLFYVPLQHTTPQSLSFFPSLMILRLQIAMLDSIKALFSSSFSLVHLSITDSDSRVDSTTAIGYSGSPLFFFPFHRGPVQLGWHFITEAKLNKYQLF